MAEKEPAGIGATHIAVAIAAAVILNLVGGVVNDVLRLPTTLDMIGTTVVALTLGPWWGILTSVLTSGILSVTSGTIALPGTIANLVAALIWGFGARWGMGSSLPKFLALNALVALGASLASVLVSIFSYAFGSAETAAFVGLGRRAVVTVFASGLVVSLADKIASGFIALAIITALPTAFRTRLEVAQAPRQQLAVWIGGSLVLAILIVLLLSRFTAG